MESGKGEFDPSDRIGQLTMRNLDISDSFDKIQLYRNAGLLSSSGVDSIRLTDDR